MSTKNRLYSKHDWEMDDEWEMYVDDVGEEGEEVDEVGEEGEG